MTPANYPSLTDIAKAIAKPFDGEEFSPVARQLGLSWSDGDKLDAGVEVYDFFLKDLGLNFTFEDEGVLFDREYHDAGDGPFVLTKCAFWGHERGMQRYPGSLWQGISFEDSLEAVKEKLGEPTKVNERGGVYFWVNADFRLTVTWTSPEKIRVVTCWMNRS